MSKPIFLLASERSGTNLLRRRLSESQITAYGPSPLHFLKHLYFAEPYYGDLSKNDNFKKIVEDALGLAYNHFSPWDEKISIDEVIDQYQSIFQGRRSTIGLMHVIYTIYAIRKGYTTYFCKDNNLFDFVCEIQQAIPEAKFIYLFRDPRDFVLSQLGRPTQVKSFFYLANLWRDEQIKCIRQATALEDNRSIIKISYEQLISDERKVVNDICDLFRLNLIKQEEQVFKKEKTDIEEWKNLNKTTITNNFGKYKKHMSHSNIRKVESIAWHQMRFLGYVPESYNKPKFSNSRIYLEFAFSKIARKLKSQLIDSKLTAGQQKRAAHTRAIANRFK